MHHLPDAETVPAHRLRALGERCAHFACCCRRVKCARQRRGEHHHLTPSSCPQRSACLPQSCSPPIVYYGCWHEWWNFELLTARRRTRHGSPCPPAFHLEACEYPLRSSALNFAGTSSTGGREEDIARAWKQMSEAKVHCAQERGRGVAKARLPSGLERDDKLLVKEIRLQLNRVAVSGTALFPGQQFSLQLELDLYALGLARSKRKGAGLHGDAVGSARPYPEATRRMQNILDLPASTHRHPSCCAHTRTTMPVAEARGLAQGRERSPLRSAARKMQAFCWVRRGHTSTV